MFKQAGATLKTNKEHVNDLNVFPVPDGDTGTNMSMTFESALNEMSRVQEITAESVTEAASNGSLMGARGNSGVILSQILRGFHKGCRGKSDLNTKDFSLALTHAADTAYKAVMKPVEGTILTVVRAAADTAESICEDHVNFDEFLENIILESKTVLAKTPEMLPVLKQAGVVDAGGQGLVHIFEGFYGAIVGEKVKEIEIAFKSQMSKETQMAEKNAEIEFGYCTEFIIKGTGLSDRQVKEELTDFGDSLLVVGHDEILKVHVHTNEPGAVLEKALLHGELIDIKIDNMRYQHNEAHSDVVPISKSGPAKEYGVLAVAMGDGLAAILKDLNTDQIIEGGQTMNPSTEELLGAIEEIHANKIIVLPNNSNIILAAQQAQKISAKDISIVPTKTIPQGITAMLAFNPDISLDMNMKNMIAAMDEVKTVQVTYAVRDSVFNGKEIKKDDILGIFNGDIVSVGKDINDVALDALDKAIDGADEIITVYYGDSISKEEAEGLRHQIEDLNEEIDVEIYEGKQPVYHYIISIE